MQKSAEGFLSEILRQLLEQRKELFPLIYSNFAQVSKTFAKNEANTLNGPSPCLEPLPFTTSPVLNYMQIQGTTQVLFVR